MFHFSVIVIQKVLKALATSVGSIYFSLFTVMWEPVLLTVLSLCLSLNVPCCFYSVITFCCILR